MATPLIAGASLAGTSISAILSSLEHKVASVILTENWTQWTLDDPIAYPDDGLIIIPPMIIQPGHKEAMVARNKGFTFCGTYGTVSWKITPSSRESRRVVVMWSSPFNHVFNKNHLAIGITKPGDTVHEKKMFEKMYSGQQGNLKCYQKEEYFEKTVTISLEDDDLMISGNMGSGHRNAITIVIQPKTADTKLPQKID